MDVENKRIACKIDMSDIVVALHKKAIERSELKLSEKIDELVKTAIDTTETIWVE